MHSWTEHRNKEGRVYWYNPATRESVWEKPTALKTPIELALTELGWKQYDSNGRPYYVNAVSNTTTWEIPSDVKNKADQVAADIAKRGEETAAKEKEMEKEKEASPASTAPSRPAPAPAPTPSNATTSAAIGPGAAAASTDDRPAATQSRQAPNGQAAASPASAPAPASSMQLAAPGQFGPSGSPYPQPAGSLQQQQQQAPVNLNFETKEEAEEAFFSLLRKYNVNPSWGWEQVLRTTVTDPLYRALRTLGERKAAYEKFVDDYKRREREAKEKSMERNRPAWRTALGRLSEGDYAMKSWWSWERASRVIAEAVPDVWHMSRHDEEREALWREYMDELHVAEVKREREVRQMNIEKLASVLKALDLDLGVRYPDARDIVRESKEWKEDTTLQAIEPLDFLVVYEESVKRAEQHAHELRSKQKAERQRAIRKSRQAYIGLLDELKQQGKIKAGTKWQDIYSEIKDDARFLDMLGNPGSTPLELFWDVVDDLDYKIEEDSRIVENVLHERTGETFKVTPETKFEDFDARVNDHIRVRNMKIEDRQAVFQGLLDRLAAQAREEQRRAERRVRHLADDLRYALKKLHPPVALGTSYEDALPRFSDLPEFQDLEGHEDARRSAFDKYVKRLAEKAAEDEAEEEAKEKRRLAADAAAASTAATISGAAAAAERERERERGKDKDRRDRERDRRDRDRDGHISDADSNTSRHRRRASRTATDVGGRGGTPTKRDGKSNSNGSGARVPGEEGSPRASYDRSSRRERQREYSPDARSHRAGSGDARDDRDDRDRRERERERERSGRSSRTHKDRADDRDRERDQDGRRRSSRKDGNDTEPARDHETDRAAKSSRRDDEPSGTKEREPKRQKRDGEAGEADKEEGEI